MRKSKQEINAARCTSGGHWIASLAIMHWTKNFYQVCLSSLNYQVSENAIVSFSGGNEPTSYWVLCYVTLVFRAMWRNVPCWEAQQDCSLLQLRQAEKATHKQEWLSYLFHRWVSYELRLNLSPALGAWKAALSLALSDADAWRFWLIVKVKSPREPKYTVFRQKSLRVTKYYDNHDLGQHSQHVLRENDIDEISTALFASVFDYLYGSSSLLDNTGEAQLACKFSQAQDWVSNTLGHNDDAAVINGWYSTEIWQVQEERWYLAVDTHIPRLHITVRTIGTGYNVLCKPPSCLQAFAVWYYWK